MARPTRPTGAGQWALGHLEPLNPHERMKKDDDGLNVRARIENIYSKRGLRLDRPVPTCAAGCAGGGSTPSARPASTAARPRILEPEELDDEYFMLRVRIPGGALTSEQLRVVAGIATEFGRDVADVTDRQNIQLHWIRIEDVPEIWRRLEAVGLSTGEACGDTPRNMLGCPLAGVDADEILDAHRVLLAVNDLAVGNPEFSNLPRKYKTAISGCPVQCTAHEINDVSFVGVDARTARSATTCGSAAGCRPTRSSPSGSASSSPPDQVEVWAGVTGSSATTATAGRATGPG